MQKHLPEDGCSRAATIVLFTCTIYILGLAFHRLVYSPIAGFPGPKLAAVTGWYEFYYDVVKKGKFLFEIERLHDQYGPIVRINPKELSIRDSKYYDELYVVGSVRPTDNYDTFATGLEFEGSHFLSTGHELHRRRRRPLEPFFSRAGVRKLEPMVADICEKLVVDRFGRLKGTGKVVRLDHAFTAFSGDVITRLCVDDPPNLVDDPDFAPEWFGLFQAIIKSLPMFMSFPWLIRLVHLIPEHILMKMDPRSQRFNEFKLMCQNHIEVVKRETPGPSSQNVKRNGPISLFRYLISSDILQSELANERLVKEAQVLLGAGSVSTARTLDFICYYVMVNPVIRQRLTADLKDVMEGYPARKPTWAQLEKVEYLQALIKEGLRLSYGVMHRLPRISPHQALHFRHWTIPAGVPVGMSAYFQHTDPHIFPRPFEFIPERWLEGATPEMRNSWVPFSKGSRGCLGANLAYCELNFVLSALFRPGGPDVDLYDTSESDITPVHDFIIPLPRMRSKGRSPIGRASEAPYKRLKLMVLSSQEGTDDGEWGSGCGNPVCDMGAW